MGKFTNIVVGHANMVRRKNGELYAKRLEVCKKCVNFLQTSLCVKCSYCGCTLSAKLRVKSERCPIKKW